MFYGDGREERMSATAIVIEGMKPKWEARRKAYWDRRAAKAREGEAMGKAAMIDALINHNRAYIRELLETEDDRFGAGSLADRYGATFMNQLPQQV